MIDPKEIRVLKLALKQFDEAYVDLMQASQRILLLAQQYERVEEPAIIPSTPPFGYLGDPCPNCHAMLLVKTGTCSTCRGCGESSGC
mgnify:CR=1 FL=1